MIQYVCDYSGRVIKGALFQLVMGFPYQGYTFTEEEMAMHLHLCQLTFESPEEMARYILEKWPKDKKKIIENTKKNPT